LELLTGATEGLGWSEDQFWASDPRTLAAAQDYKSRQREDEFRAEWERTRWMAAVIISPHLKRPIAPRKLLEFEWETPARSTKPEDYPKIADGLGRKIK
jgi:hypothetical protein